jgi:hypothetical protein
MIPIHPIGLPKKVSSCASIPVVMKPNHGIEHHRRYYQKCEMYSETGGEWLRESLRVEEGPSFRIYV